MKLFSGMPMRISSGNIQRMIRNVLIYVQTKKEDISMPGERE